MSEGLTSSAQLSRRYFLRLAGGVVGALTVGCAPKMPTSTETPLPDYVDGGSGIPVYRGPYQQREARIAAFLLPARLEALRALCDTYLNTPTDGAVAYKPLALYILLLYAEMQIQSLDARDQAIGWMPETEVGFWIPTTTRTNQAGWFLPYLFVDNPYAILAGREVYGFPKTWGHFEKAASIHNPEFAVDVWGFSEFDAQAEGKSQQLLEVRKSDRSAPDAAPETWTSWDAARSALIRLLFKDWQPQADDNNTRGFPEKIPLVFLKQFRDATDSRKVCYQAIIEAAAQPGTFYDGGFIDAAYTLTCHSLASHPIADTLGLNVDSSGAAQALAAFWLRLDFTLGPGVEVWRAP